MTPDIKPLTPEAADPFDGPHSRPFIELDRSSVRLVAAAVAVFWLAVWCFALVVTSL